MPVDYRDLVEERHLFPDDASHEATCDFLQKAELALIARKDLLATHKSVIERFGCTQDRILRVIDDELESNRKHFRHLIKRYIQTQKG